MKIAIMFSGQGSQFANMGLEFFTKHPEKIKKANKILDFDILKVLKNENNELNNTVYTQTLMTLMMIIIYDEVKDIVNPDGLLGFSLGEYSALYAAGVFDFEETLKLIKHRACLMEKVTAKYPGKMVAVLNTDLDKLTKIVNDINNNNQILTIANYNSRKQFVISGSSEAIDEAIIQLKEIGTKRIIPLNVSGAFHSELMNEASEYLNEYLKTLKINENKVPVYLNTTAKPLIFNDLVSELTKQIKSSVYFYQSIENMINDGYTDFIEIGPGTVLSNLVKRNYEINVYNIENLDDFNKWRNLNVRK